VQSLSPPPAILNLPLQLPAIFFKMACSGPGLISAGCCATTSPANTNAHPIDKRFIELPSGNNDMTHERLYERTLSRQRSNSKLPEVRTGQAIKNVAIVNWG